MVRLFSSWCCKCWPSKTLAFSVLLMPPAPLPLLSLSSLSLQWTFWQLLTPFYQTMLCQLHMHYNNFLSGFHDYGMLSSHIVADNILMCGCIVNKWVCLMICTNHLCCCSRMTPDLTLCVHVYSLFGLCTVILSSGWWQDQYSYVTSIVYVSHETDDLLVLVTHAVWLLWAMAFSSMQVLWKPYCKASATLEGKKEQQL